jgi:predicted AAA+ superfamily ATPase
MPAVVVSGARQTGKSTLAQDLTPGARRFISLDDLDAMELARRDPEALVEGPPVTLDEVQREPDLLRAVKRAIDRDRRAGRFLLTGSANLLLMRGVSESLAGRASYLTLWPMARREQRGLGRYGLWEELLPCRTSGASCERPVCAWASSSTRPSWRATWPCRSRRCTGT